MKTSTECPAVTARFAHGRKDTMHIQAVKFPRPPDELETAAPGWHRGDGKENLHTNKANRNTRNQQAAVRAIEAGLVCLPDACDTAFILRRRLDLPERVWLAASAILALPAETAEGLAEAALCDLCAGPPPVTFWSLRDEAHGWAMFTSRAERCHYLAAAWGRLSQDDRRRFLRRAI